ncbi:hypothetical protein DL96DRAFT_1789399 [Flagelloscypha sp. PMI_526]|nr:hypothetical protein DL96DRAFT_1789399 [Flagelloscypha sp. PMI_526]
MSAAQFPAELLEQIVPHLADNPAALSTCCLSSRVFVPACRIVRFQSITLDDQRKDSSRFNALLEASPPSAVAIYVRCLRVMDPHRFGYEKGRDAIALARILNYFRTFPIHLQIFSKHRPGISWSHIRWLQDAISELSSIQSFGTEDRFTTFPTNTSWPAYGDVAALGLFSFPYDFKKTTETLGRLRLSAFRLSDIGSRSIQMYLNNALLKWLDLSGLRALAFCTKIGETPDTTGAWLSALIQRCSATLEYLVFEPRDPPNGIHKVHPSTKFFVLIELLQI